MDRGRSDPGAGGWTFLVASACAVLLAASGCSGTGKASFGEPVDVGSARRLADVLETPEPTGGDATTVVAGEIAEVCTTSGCWFTLRDVKDGRMFELLIDLKGGASFTVPQSIRGRPAVVRGRIVGTPPDLKLLADGLVVE